MTKMAADASCSIDDLPEDCLLDVISLTSPRDAYNFFLASTGFRSVVDSDFIWQAFLPLDYAATLSRAVDPVVYTSMKDLFFQLSDHHVLIDGGKMSFGLERSSGAKCFMMSANILHITFADAPHSGYWRRLSVPDSKFSEVVEPIAECQLDILGKINIKELSSKTKYGAYLVYKLTKTKYGDPIGQIRQKASVTIGSHASKSTVYLEPFYDIYARKVVSEWNAPYEVPGFDNNGEITAKERDDGWIEVELGEFYNDYDKNGEVEMKLEQAANDGLSWKGGLMIQGIEIRPKH